MTLLFFDRVESLVTACEDLSGRCYASNHIEGKLFYLSEWVDACEAGLAETGAAPFYPEPLRETPEEIMFRREKAHRCIMHTHLMQDFFRDELRLALYEWYRIIHTGRYNDDSFKRFMWGNFRRYMHPMLENWRDV